MRLLIAALAMICVPLTAAGQSTATVRTNAPIYVTNTPAAGLLPLRVAAVGTVLKVLGEEGEWLQVEFQDPQWGRRLGWVEKKHVTVTDPNLQPMDLSVRDTATVPPARHDVDTQLPQRQRQGDASPSSGRSQMRDGFWFNVGLGYGSLGCDDCSGREGGLSGGLALGGTLGDKWLLGVGTTGWAKDVGGELLTVGTLDLRFRFYPVITSGFFLTGGGGVGTLSYAGESEVGVGIVLGLGWDIRVGRNVSVTPFWNGFAMRNSVADANVGQLGLGVTFH